MSSGPYILNPINPKPKALQKKALEQIQKNTLSPERRASRDGVWVNFSPMQGPVRARDRQPRVLGLGWSRVEGFSVLGCRVFGV